jgi:hypothetical protein
MVQDTRYNMANKIFTRHSPKHSHFWISVVVVKTPFEEGSEETSQIANKLALKFLILTGKERLISVGAGGQSIT